MDCIIDGSCSKTLRSTTRLSTLYANVSRRAGGRAAYLAAVACNNFNPHVSPRTCTANTIERQVSSQKIMPATCSKRATFHRLSVTSRKRPRLDNTGDFTPTRAGRSKPESLPTEFPETIFLDSANGNLLLAAPQIAVQLSGNEMHYRATFALACYSHNLRSVSKPLHLSSLLPYLEPPLDVRDTWSITQAVLRARWCTDGWVRNLVDVLVRHKIAPCSPRDGRSQEDLEIKYLHWLEFETCFLQCALSKSCDPGSRLQSGSGKYRVLRIAVCRPSFPSRSSLLATN